MTGNRLSQQIEEFLTRPGTQLGRGARFLRFQFELWRFCARRLRQNNLMAMSAALSFRTIFALIPILIFGFLVLKSVGVVENGKRTMRDLLDQSGLSQIAIPQEDAVGTDGAPGDPSPDDVATDGESRSTAAFNMADKIEELVTDVEGKLTFDRLGPIGALLLIWTALTLFNTLEQSLNRVFEAPRSRALARRILLFWSVLTLGPVVIVAVSYFSRMAAEAAQGVAAVSWLVSAFGWIVPVLVGMVVIAMAYKLIPNTHVRFAAAFGGAVVTVPLWLITRSLFQVYVERFVQTGNLYGVLGVLPLFMLWLNISWSVFLFGAQLAHTATNLRQFRQMEQASRRMLGPSDWLAVILAVARNFAGGKGPARFEHIVEEVALPPESVRKLLHRMVESNLLCLTDENPEPGYVVARPHDQVRLTDILDQADPLHQLGQNGESPVRTAVATSLKQMRDAMQAKTLDDLVKHDATTRGDTQTMDE